MITEEQLAEWEADALQTSYRMDVPVYISKLKQNTTSLITEVRKLRKVIEQQAEAIEFAYQWAIEQTPKIRPYDLTDKMAQAIAITVDNIEDGQTE